MRAWIGALTTQEKPSPALASSDLTGENPGCRFRLLRPQAAAKSIAAEMDNDRQRGKSRLACARLFACDTRPIVERGSLIFRRRLGISFIPSREVGSFVGRVNCCALRSESARRADSPSSFLASNLCRRAISL